MADRTIYVSDIPPDVDKADLMIYFQSPKKSGGRDVEDVELNRTKGEAKVVFVDKQAATNVLSRSHTIKGQHVIVTQQPGVTQPEEKTTQESTVMVSGLTSQSEDGIRNYFENTRRSGGGYVSDVSIHGNKAFVTFSSSEDATGVLKKTDHSLDGCPLSVSEPPVITEHAPQNATNDCSANQSRVVLVSGLAATTKEDTVRYYFENTRRSGGGEIEDVQLQEESGTAEITFHEAADAASVLEKTDHALDGCPLTVCEPSVIPEHAPQDATNQETSKCAANQSRVVLVSGLAATTKEDTVRYYFENTRRSGGGDIEDVQLQEESGTAEITFCDAADVLRVVEKTDLVLDGANLTATLKVLPQPKPVDPHRLLFSGLGEEPSIDGLTSFIEVVSRCEVRDMLFGSASNVLVTFKEQPDFEHVVTKCDQRPFEGKTLKVEQVHVCDTVHVTGITKELSHDTVFFPFENPKRGGGEIIKLDYEPGMTEAFIQYKEPSVVDDVINRTHVIGGCDLTVRPYYPSFTSPTPVDVKRDNKIDVQPNVIKFILEFHEEEFKGVSQQNMMEVRWEPGANEAYLVATVDKIARDEWENGCDNVVGYIAQITEHTIKCSQDAWEKLQSRSRDMCEEFKDSAMIDFHGEEYHISLLGKKADLDCLAEKLNDLKTEIEKEMELENAKVTRDINDISEGCFQLMKLVKLDARIKEEHKNLVVKMVEDKRLIIFTGQDEAVAKGKETTLQFMLRVKEVEVEVESNQIVLILKTSPGQNYIMGKFQDASIHAVLTFECTAQSKVLVTGKDRGNAHRGAETLKELTASQAIPIDQDQALILSTTKWKEEKDRLQRNPLVHISDSSANSITVIGIANEVDKAQDQIKRFFDENTIVTKYVELETGVRRFLITFRKNEMKVIEDQLNSQSVKITSNQDDEELLVRGTQEGTETAIEGLESLVSSIQEDKVELDKPGMQNAFNGAKGQRLIEGIEHKHKCTIERYQGSPKINLGPVAPAASEVTSKVMCSYTTPEDKTISIYKGDLTKHAADVLVNPANGELKHIGGLARAIVKAGGEEIQNECDKYIKRNGTVIDGHVAVLSAFNLPCKCLIHAVGPQWSYKATHDKEMEIVTNEEKLLGLAVRNALEKSKEYSSIALPAISTGVFGFPVDLCVRILIDTALEFSVKNRRINLRQIQFVDNNDKVIQAFTQEMKRRFDGQPQFIDHSTGAPSKNHRTKKPLLRATRKSGSSTNMAGLATNNSLVTAQGLKISVITGDLSKQQVDAIVNTGSAVLNLAQNPCARSLSNAAGPGLQQECTAGLQGKQLSCGDMLVTGGHRLKKCKSVFHVYAGSWDAGNGEQALGSLLAQCLLEAHQRGYSSIAIPAIGTGKLGFPRDVVAKVFFDKADKFRQQHPQSSLDDVRFVVYDKDQPTVQAFQQELQKRTPGGGGGAKSKGKKRRSLQVTTSKEEDRVLDEGGSSTDDISGSFTELQIGPLTLQVAAGDITQESTDAIGTPSNPDLQLDRGRGVGPAIAKVAGKTVLDECTSLGQQALGTVVCTGAGKLKFPKKIFHLVPSSPSAGDLTDIVLECLKLAESKGMQSIAFPAIGTGIIGMTPKEAAKALLSAVAMFGQEQPTRLHLVRIVVFQPHMLKDFNAAIEDLSKSGSSAGFAGAIKKIIKGGWEMLTGQKSTSGAIAAGAIISQPMRKKKSCLLVYAGSDKDLKDAVDAIDETARGNVKRTQIEHKSIEALTEGHAKQILDLQNNYDIEINVERNVNRILMQGDPADVITATTAIHKILDAITREEHTHECARLTSENVEWCFQDGEDWEPYDIRLGHQIEQAYKEKKPSIKIYPADETGKTLQCVISFKDMTETDLDSKDVTKINRKEKGKGVPLPEHWVPQPTDSSGKEQDVHLVPLDTTMDAAEYKKVHDDFMRTASGQTVVKIERVQNPPLYRMYAVMKEKMEARNGSNEKKVFHGTGHTVCDQINHKGFNRSYCGTNVGKLYGNGVYFARDASYSARPTYSPADPNTGQRYMYLASILAGDYTTGQGGMIVPPAKDPSKPTDAYDTVVDSPTNPQIYVVFYDIQCYPEYLITFI